MQPPPPEPIRFGKYELLEKIGEGGFGRVYRGRDPVLKREVAIKTLASDDPELAERFVREAEIAAGLAHPNVVVVHDFGREGGIPYLVQEYLVGEDLDDWMRGSPPPAVGERLRVLSEIARGLQHAHAHGIVHRDVKPGNVRILRDGRAKIMDFGIAKLASAERQMTKTGMSLGTAGYLPPEQLRGEKVDHRADLFSFGALAYELLSGQRPFAGDDVSTILYKIAHQDPEPLTAIWPACPERLATLVERCLEKAPADRPADFGVVLAELAAMAGEASHEAPGPTVRLPAVSRLPQRGARGEAPAGASSRRAWIAGLGLVVAAGLALALWPRREPVTPPAKVIATDPDQVAAEPAAAPSTSEADGVPRPPPPTIAPSAPAPGLVGAPPHTAPVPEGPASSPGATAPSARLLVVFTGDDEARATAEASLLEQLATAGQSVVDATRTAELRADEAAMAAVGGQDARRIAAIGRRLGAELVLSANLRSETQPAAGKFHTGRADLAWKLVRAETAEVIAADTASVGSGGRPGKFEPSPEAARNAAAREAANLAATAVVASAGTAPAPSLVVIVHGAGDAAEAAELEALLAALPGAGDLTRRSYVAGERLEVALAGVGDAAATGLKLEGRSLRNGRLRVQSTEGSRLILEVLR